MKLEMNVTASSRNIHQWTDIMVHHSMMTHLGEDRGWFAKINIKKRRAAIPAANWILIKQRRYRGFRPVIYDTESAQHKNQRMGLRHQRLQHFLLLVIGCSLIEGGHALGQGGHVAGLAGQVALYPGILSLGSLFYPQPCSAGSPATQKHVGISEINSHGPGDTHVSKKYAFNFQFCSIYFCLNYRIASLLSLLCTRV